MTCLDSFQPQTENKGKNEKLRSGQLISSNIPLFVNWKLYFEGITYPSSSSRSTRDRLEIRVNTYQGPQIWG
jgi:hypothetical protein